VLASPPRQERCREPRAQDEQLHRQARLRPREPFDKGRRHECARANEGDRPSHKKPGAEEACAYARRASEASQLANRHEGRCHIGSDAQAHRGRKDRR